MRMLVNVTIPTEEFNAAVRDGTASAKLADILEQIKPEAVYFTEQNEQRGALLVVEIDDPSSLPRIAEPWFLTFNARMEFRIAMTLEDVKKAGLEDLGKRWG